MPRSVVASDLSVNDRKEVVMTMHSAEKLVAVTCVSLFLVGGWASAVHAQAIHEGKLAGTVASEDQAVIPGATVEISSPALMSGARSATTTGTACTCS